MKKKHVIIGVTIFILVCIALIFGGIASEYYIFTVVGGLCILFSPFIIKFLKMFIETDAEIKKQRKELIDGVRSSCLITTSTVAEFLKNHPSESKVLDDLKALITKYGPGEFMCEELLIANPSIIIAFVATNAIIVYTKNMVLVYQINSNMHMIYHGQYRYQGHRQLTTSADIEYHSDTIKNGDASIAGRAVAGAMLGGGVGAAIGAASAINKNAKGGNTTSVNFEVDTGRRYLKFEDPDFLELNSKIHSLHLNHTSPSVEKFYSDHKFEFRNLMDDGELKMPYPLTYFNNCQNFHKNSVYRIDESRKNHKLERTLYLERHNPKKFISSYSSLYSDGFFCSRETSWKIIHLCGVVYTINIDD